MLLVKTPYPLAPSLSSINENAINFLRSVKYKFYHRVTYRRVCFRVVMNEITSKALNVENYMKPH